MTRGPSQDSRRGDFPVTRRYARATSKHRYAMQPTGTTPKVVRIRKLEVDLHTGNLWKNGVRTKLPEQPRQILAILVDNAGKLVTRETVRKTLWLRDTFVDFEHSLNTAMMRLREALGDSSEHPRFIETLPRRGYRLVAPVEPVEPEVAEAAIPLNWSQISQLPI